MKKFFTLIAAVAMAASVNAQGTYAVAVGDAFVAGQKIETVDNAVLTLSPEIGEMNAGKKTDNWADADFKAYTYAKTVNGTYHADAAPTGGYYQIDTKKAGKLTVAVQLANDKAFYVLDKSFKEIEYSYLFPDNKTNGNPQTMTTRPNEKNADIIEHVIGTKSNGTATFDVEADGTYYVFAAGTKLGFFGFKYTVDTTNGIATVTPPSTSAKSTTTYNLAGQQVSDSYKGIVIKNGKKYLK